MPLRHLLLLLLALRLSAVEIDAPPRWTPVLKVPDGQQPIEIRSARYEICVRGVFAETTATYVFANPNPRILTGELTFPLPDGATVCGYALDVRGELVDGVVVGKDEARVILSTESRIRRDPGLVEQVRGNLFRTRIFPLPAFGTRTVRISWTAALERSGQRAAARVLLPRTRLPVLDLHVDVAATGAAPVLSGFGDLHLTEWQGSQVAEAHLRDVVPGDDLAIDLPTVPPVLTMVERRGVETFAAIAIGTGGPQAGAAVAPPPRIAVAWDASSARTPAAIARAQAALLALMQRWPGTVFDVRAFRDVPGPAAPCRTPAELQAHLQRLAYDGDAALGALDLTRAQLPNPADRCWILVANGLGGIGDTVPSCGDVPVFVLACEPIQDAQVLEVIAARTGGEVIPAIDLAPEAAAGRLAAPAPHLLRLECAAGVLDAVQIHHGDGNDLVLARLVQDGDVRLISGRPGGATTVQTVHLQLAAAAPGAVIARAWAGAQAQAWGIDPVANRDRLLALGRTYGVVTAGSSLLVLESLDQYLHYGIEPPASWPQMLGDFKLAQQQRQQFELQQRWLQQEDLVHRWQERVGSWQATGGHATPLEVRSTGEPPLSTLPPGDRPASQPPLQGARVLPPIDVPARAQDAEEERGQAPAAPSAGFGGRAVAAIGAASTDGERLGGVGGWQPEGGDDGAEGVSAATTITPFQPDVPYLHALAAAPPASAYATYLEQRARYRDSPSFYLDCGGFFLRHEPRLGHRILSNLLAMRLEDPGLLRIAAWRLTEAGDVDAAITILRHVLQLRPEEPQSYRDLATVLAQHAEATGHAQEAEEAMDLLARIVTSQPFLHPGTRLTDILEGWRRAPDLDLIALEELNRLIAWAQRTKLDRPCAIPPLDPRLRQNLDTDLRVVMGWDQDATDIDLHVIEPSGEEAFYAHRQTASGGLVSRDNTIGYGPEEYVLHDAPTGTYQIACRYYASHALDLFGPATVTATVFLDWGRPTERRSVLTLRLDRPGDQVAVGSVNVASHARSTGAPPPSGSVLHREQVTALQRGASQAAVEASLGPPQRVDHDGVTILVYTLDRGTEVRLGFGPELLYAREILEGAERDLLR